MADYLLSIELRKADSIKNETGDIVLLSQAWCNDDGIEREFISPSLTGGRFLSSLKCLLDNPDFINENEIRADPRIKNGE